MDGGVGGPTLVVFSSWSSPCCSRNCLSVTIAGSSTGPPCIHWDPLCCEEAPMILKREPPPRSSTSLHVSWANLRCAAPLCGDAGKWHWGAAWVTALRGLKAHLWPWRKRRKPPADTYPQGFKARVGFSYRWHSTNLTSSGGLHRADSELDKTGISWLTSVDLHHWIAKTLKGDLVSGCGLFS